MTGQDGPVEAAGFVEAQLKYLADDSGPVEYVASRGGGDATEHKGDYVMHRVAVHDARGENFGLDRQGFELVERPSAVDDFYDDGQIEAVHEQEVKALVRDVTGADRVEIFDHTRRAASLDVQKARTIREPASIVHNDYTADSGPRRLRDHFLDKPEEAQARLERRFAIVNVWRSINGPVLSAPLALCDAASVEPGDLVSVVRQARERIGEIQQAVFNPAHRWYYYPRMSPGEVLLIKTYDSAEDGRARFTLHTSFEDPATAAGDPPRESIETRCFAFF